MTLYETILANAQHAKRNCQVIQIGGGVFTGAEVAEVARLAVAATDLLAALEAAVEYGDMGPEGYAGKLALAALAKVRGI